MLRFLFLLTLIPTFSFAQNNRQNIRGVISDKLSQIPLIGVPIQIASLQKSTTTDTLGKYTLSNIPSDRYEIKVSYIGYKNITIPNVVITAGKEAMALKEILHSTESMFLMY
jgi:hypothetical protein